MTENEYLEMPWSIEDTIENLNEIKENFKVILINKNLDGKASDDVKELEFDFDRAIKALEKQIPKKPIVEYKDTNDCITEIEWKCPICGTNYIELAPCGEWCNYCGQKLDWSEESEQ